MKLLTISGSPHIHGGHSVKKLMRGVIVAMMPALLVSFYYFGLSAFIVTMVSVFACMFFEWFIQKFIMKVPTSITDGSAMVTGILLAFNVPSNLPIWIILIGALVSIGIGKMTYGGLGKNPFNPALVGRVFLLISFPVQMTTWPKSGLPFSTLSFDGLTGPTPLGILKGGLSQGESVSQVMNNVDMPRYADLLYGQMGGSLGEVSAIALIIGGLFLIFRKVITWHIPVAFIGTSFIFASILHMVNPELYVDPFFHLITGGLMLGAFFMATDLVTSPMSKTGQLVFGVGCGLLTILIRVWGAYPEGVSFAILLMNATTPLINNAFKPKQFGKAIKLKA